MPRVKSKHINFTHLYQTPDADFELARLLGITRDAIRKVRQRELNKINIHARRSAILLVIQNLGDKATSSTIATQLLRKQHTISKLLTKMENDGQIKKIYNIPKKNRFHILLTKKGENLIKQAFKRESIYKFFNTLSESELKKFEIYLKKLRNGICGQFNITRTTPYLPSEDKLYVLYGLLIETVDLIRSFRRKELSKYDIDLTYSAILLTINALGEKATPTAIGTRLLRERHTLSELLIKMENDGLIKRINDLHKRNMVRAILTEKGYKHSTLALKGNSHNEIMSYLLQQERDQLQIYLKRLLEKALNELKGWKKQ